MSKFTVDSFIVELGFSENVIKGLQRVEKAALQSAQRIEGRDYRYYSVVFPFFVYEHLRGET